MFEYKYIIIYSIITIVSIFNYKKFNHNFQLKMWWLFLIYSFLTEIMARYTIEKYNIGPVKIYNIWWLANSFFYQFFFLSQIKNSKKRKIVQGFIAVYGLYVLISSLFYKDYGSVYLVDSWVLGQLFVVLTIMLYYTELLKSDTILNIKYSLLFWISIGALIFNIGILPVFVIAELIRFQGIFRHIILGLNMVLSLCFIIGFIVSKKEFNN